MNLLEKWSSWRGVKTVKIGCWSCYSMPFKHLRSTDKHQIHTYGKDQSYKYGLVNKHFKFEIAISGLILFYA